MAKSVKIFEKYGENFATWMNVVAVAIGLLWLLHTFTCFWFVAGDRVEECAVASYTDATGTRVLSPGKRYIHAIHQLTSLLWAKFERDVPLSRSRTAAERKDTIGTKGGW